MPKPKRFVIWRREPSEICEDGIAGDGIQTLQNRIQKARETIEDGDYDTVMVLEVRKVVHRHEVKPPITVKDF